MTQPLENPSLNPRCPPCGALPPFGLASALAPSRLPYLSFASPPTSGAYATHPMLMLQWMRSLLSSQGVAPPPPPPPPHTPPTSNTGGESVFCGSLSSEAFQLAGLLSGAKGGSSPLEVVPAPPHPSSPSMPTPPLPHLSHLNPYCHGSSNMGIWQHTNQEDSEQLRRFRQALCTGNLDSQTLKFFQNLKYSLKMSGNGTPRRKNTTRETTGLLKAWLNEHRKNPYPNKSEKIMLAVITKMSLTQVSTWFANARRRLKKENKATWSLASSVDQHFPELEDGNLSAAPGELYPSDPMPAIPIQHNISPLPQSFPKMGEEFDDEMKSATTLRMATSVGTRRNGKIWSVVEMTEER